jgi:hypothetical protein
MREPSEGTLVSGDATLYDYGPEGWQCIFNRIPEIIHGPLDPDREKDEAAERAGWKSRATPSPRTAQIGQTIMHLSST